MSLDPRPKPERENEMPSEQVNEPIPGNPGEHWGTTHPEDQPPRAAVTGLRRQVLEARLRLGPDATPDTVATDLRAAGMDVDPAEVARCFNDPYAQPDGE